MKLEFSQQTFLKILKHQISQKSIHWELSCSLWIDIQMDGQTGRHDKANSCFHNFVNTPKTGQYHM
jgi:hypothetical protein